MECVCQAVEVAGLPTLALFRNIPTPLSPVPRMCGHPWCRCASQIDLGRPPGTQTHQGGAWSTGFVAWVLQ